MPEFTPPTKLGVGFTYQKGLTPLIEANGKLIDFFEVTPDVLCYERLGHTERTLDYNPELLAMALEETSDRPIVVHGLNLSIGSATSWNSDYLDVLDRLYSQRRFEWHSEHLNFLTTNYPDGRPLHTGVPLPVPFTDEALDLIVPRATQLIDRFGTPFLLENLTCYLPQMPSDRNRDEIDFLNALTEASSCGLLLDLYNLYCNAVNFCFDPVEALSRLRLDRVIEIHLAGGTSNHGFMMDVHSRLVPETVWNLLDYVVPRAPNLSGIVFEVLEEAVPQIGVSRIRSQLERIHQAWSRSVSRSEVTLCR